MEQRKLYINSAWQEGSAGDTQDILNPATGQVVGQVALATLEDLDAAISSAEIGLDDWANVSAWDRGIILKKSADLLRERCDEIACSLTKEHGKTLKESETEILRAADFLEWGGEEARRISSRHFGARDVNATVGIEMVPIGVVAAFSPWNYPVLLTAKKLAALLAAGCSCVVKPAEETPSAAIALLKCLLDAGLPGNVINMVFGDPGEISSTLIEDRRIAKISFTGSIPVGKLLAAQAGKKMKPITMELGGHSPVIVFDDADLNVVVPHLIARKFSNSSQICVAPNRFYVHEKIFDRFRDLFCEQAGAIKIGNGANPDTTMGPLANVRRVDAVSALVDDAVKQGAKIELGGEVPKGPGYFFPPTVLTNVSPSCELMQDEPFGPVVPLVSFSDEKEVMDQANDTKFGLAAYVFTQDRARQVRFAQGLHAGCIGINDVPSHTAEIPLGGWKESGIGTEGGIELTQAYLKSKLVYTVNS